MKKHKHNNMMCIRNFMIILGREDLSWLYNTCTRTSKVVISWIMKCVSYGVGSYESDEMTFAISLDGDFVYTLKGTATIMISYSIRQSSITVHLIPDSSKLVNKWKSYGRLNIWKSTVMEAAIL